MSNNTSMSNETQKQNITDIQSLQKTEKELLDNLELNPNLSEDIKKQIIDKINALSNMRMDLFDTLNNVNSLYNSNAKKSEDILFQQSEAIDIEEKNLNEFKRRLKTLQDKQLQELRITEINKYFSSKYADHANIVMALIYLFIGLIIINFLYKSEIMPVPIYWALVIILTAFIAYKFWYTLLLSYIRNNMNYDNLDFTPPSSTTTSTNTTTSSNDPWYKPTTACIGSQCCTSGMVFDTSLNLCVVNASSSSDTNNATV